MFKIVLPIISFFGGILLCYIFTNFPKNKKQEFFEVPSSAFLYPKIKDGQPEKYIFSFTPAAEPEITGDLYSRAKRGQNSIILIKDNSSFLLFKIGGLISEDSVEAIPLSKDFELNLKEAFKY